MLTIEQEGWRLMRLMRPRWGKPMLVKHVCQSCGEVMAVPEHSSWQEVKDCQAGMRGLCDECQRFPGSPLPKDGIHHCQRSATN